MFSTIKLRLAVRTRKHSSCLTYLLRPPARRPLGVLDQGQMHDRGISLTDQPSLFSSDDEGVSASPPADGWTRLIEIEGQGRYLGSSTHRDCGVPLDISHDYPLGHAGIPMAVVMLKAGGRGWKAVKEDVGLRSSRGRVTSYNKIRSRQVRCPETARSFLDLKCPKSRVGQAGLCIRTRPHSKTSLPSHPLSLRFSLHRSHAKRSSFRLSHG